MYDLDDLIQEIHKNETVEITRKLSRLQKSNIKKQVLSSNTVIYKKRVFMNRTVIALAAALVLVFGLTAFAAEKYEWDVALTNFMGLNDPSTLQLESGEVKIDATSKSGGVSITEITSLGDKNTAYIRIDTDYELPSDFDETTDYILPENHSIRISDKKNGASKDYGAALTGFYENNKLGFLLEISNCDSLNQSYVSLSFENLILYHDLHIYDDSAEPEEFLLSGKWDLEWKYSYKSSTSTYRILKKVNILENAVWLTKVDVSPISVRIVGHRKPQDFAKDWQGSVEIQEIGFKDGIVLEEPSMASSGRSNTTFDYYVSIYEFGEMINPDELDYIILGNQRIEF